MRPMLFHAVQKCRRPNIRAQCADQLLSARALSARAARAQACARCGRVRRRRTPALFSHAREPGFYAMFSERCACRHFAADMHSRKAHHICAGRYEARDWSFMSALLPGRHRVCQMFVVCLRLEEPRER